MEQSPRKCFQPATKNTFITIGHWTIAGGANGGKPFSLKLIEQILLAKMGGRSMVTCDCRLQKGVKPKGSTP